MLYYICEKLECCSSAVCIPKISTASIMPDENFERGERFEFMLTDKIVEILQALPPEIKNDFGAYVGCALAIIVFALALSVALVATGELGTFKRQALSALEEPSHDHIMAQMQCMPTKVKKMYKRAILTCAKPSDIVSVDAAVNVPFARSMISKLPVFTAIGAFVAMTVGVGISTGTEGVVGASAGIAATIIGFVGGALVLASVLVSSVTYKNAIVVYDALMDALDSLAKNNDFIDIQDVSDDSAQNTGGDWNGTAEPQQARSGENATFATSQPEADAAARQAEELARQKAAQAEARRKAEQEALAAQKAAQQAAMAKAAQEAIAAQKAAMAKAAQAAQAEQNRNAAQQRLEELKAQREAQMRAQHEAQAQQRAAQAAANGENAPSVTAADIIAKIDRLDLRGGTLAEMKEAALLLQKERAKTENRTPELMKSLSDAQMKLMKIMNAAIKK